jgi:DNA-binding NarL/FixJ family response regulator
MIRIAIVDDHAILREGLRRFLSESAELTVVGEAANGHDALDPGTQARHRRAADGPLDAEQSGVEVLSAIKALAPGLPVLMLRGFSGRQYARQ